MDIIKMTRELGKAVQNLDEYKRMVVAKKANDEDETLQSQIGEFNLLRMDINNEIQKQERNEERLAELDKQIKQCHKDIMSNANMNNYNQSKAVIDELMNNIVNILSMCVNGADPDTCEPQSSCSGSCSSCSGCN